jgi:type IV pilus assembly protein PilV
MLLMKIPSKLRINRHRGMTLIEVLVSLLIFSFGFLGLIGMQAKAVQISTDAEDRSRASLLANEIVSKMWMNKSLSVSQSDKNAWIARVQDPSVSGLPSAGGDVSNPVNGLVTVTVTWRSPARNVSASDSQYVTQVMMPPI